MSKLTEEESKGVVMLQALSKLHKQPEPEAVSLKRWREMTYPEKLEAKWSYTAFVLGGKEEANGA